MSFLRAVLATILLLSATKGFAQEHLLGALDGREFPKGATRLALIVWAENYNKLSNVKNAGSDGSRIAQEFHKLQFDFVRVIPDADSANAILDGVNELKAQIAASIRPVVVVFFFAGHGFQVEGENYLVPTSASNNSTLELVEYSVSLTEISRRLNPARKAGMLLLMLDSCRTIQFLEDGSLKDIPIRDDIQPGFQEGNLLAPALVSMAAAPKQAARSASRYEGKNSPYTNAVAPLLGVSGLSLAKLLQITQRRVIQDTDESQQPSWFNVSWSSTFFFRPRDIELQDDERAWQVVLTRPTSLRGCAQDYLQIYPTGQFALQAEYLLSLVDKPSEFCSVN